MKSQLSGASDRPTPRWQFLGGAVAAAALLALAGARAEATTITQIQLLGGSTTDGADLNSSASPVAFYADSGDTNQSLSFQGVTFTPYSGTESLPTNVVVGYTGSGAPSFLPANSVDTASNASFTDSTDTTDNNAILGLVNKGLDFFPSAGSDTATITYTGLNDAQAYTVDLFVSDLGYATRSFTISVTAANGATSTTFGSGNGHAIDDENITGIMPSDNQIAITLTSTGGTGVIFNAAVLTGVPEPTSLGFLGVASVGLLARRRRSA